MSIVNKIIQEVNEKYKRNYDEDDVWFALDYSNFKDFKIFIDKLEIHEMQVDEEEYYSKYCYVCNYGFKKFKYFINHLIKIGVKIPKDFFPELARHGKFKSLKYIMKKSNDCDEWALYHASRSGFINIVKYLAHKGIPINVETYEHANIFKWTDPPGLTRKIRDCLIFLGIKNFKITKRRRSKLRKKYRNKINKIIENFDVAYIISSYLI